jgi:hypothetical protein
MDEKLNKLDRLISILEDIYVNKPSLFNTCYEKIWQYYKDQHLIDWWEEKDTMIRIGDQKGIRCSECGSNVFRFSKDHKKAKCNGCQAIFTVE